MTTNYLGLWYASFGLDKTLIENPLPQIHLSKPWSQKHEFAFLEHLSVWPLLSPLWWCYLQAWFYHYHNSASWQVSDCNNLHLQKFTRLEKEVTRPQVSRPPMSSSDWDLTFTWHSPNIHLTFTWHSPEPHLTTWPSSDLPLTLTRPLPNLD